MSFQNGQSGRRTSASTSPASSPLVATSSHLASHLPVPPLSGSYSSSAGPSSTSLNRQGSSSSQRSSRPSLRGMIPSPRIAPSMLPPTSLPGSGGSSAEGSRSNTGASTPRMLSRRSSTKEGNRPSGLLLRKVSDKHRRAEELPQTASGGMEGWRSPVVEGESEGALVVETPHATSRKDPETGKWMINQYMVYKEIGRGAHGAVRLGWDTSNDGASQEADMWCAIKITDRVQKGRKLQTLRKAGRSDGGKMMGESEIRKEVAIFKKVAHPNIVRLKEIIDDPDQKKIFMILELCERGEIRWKDESGGPALTIAETRRIFRDTLSGLAYLHHQGIIHRDIKPSNLLLSRDNIVKISDFGCSHYSEALAAASAQTGPEADRYVDDVELAKTAGSPAFFAPEMCYSGLDDDVTSTRESISPFGTPVGELPGFTIRPPSVASEFGGRSDLVTSPSGGRIIPLKQVQSNDSGAFRRPMSARSHSSNTVHLRKEQRLPITNAIDVWALGVTLYCLLFGRTPFDAPNEYLLMQVIPTQDFEIPSVMGRDRQPTSGPNATAEAKEAVEILRRLLEKTPGKRITLDQAKRHAFTLRDLDDPTHWLASADPRTRDFVTVSNDEVIGVTTRLSFGQKFKKGMKTIGHKLQSLGSSRSRTRSVGGYDEYSSAPGTAEQSHAPTRVGSVVNVTAEALAGLNSPAPSLRRSRMSSRDNHRDSSPMTSPPPTGSTSRRLSLFGPRLASDAVPSPRPQTVQLGSPSLVAQAETVLAPAPIFDGLDRTPTSISTPYPAASKSGFAVNRSKGHAPSHLLPPPAKTHTSTLIADTPRSPTKMASTSSLDKYGRVPTISPPPSIHRRMSDVESGAGRQRAPSNASSAQASMSGFGKLVKLLSRTSSSRSGSRFSRRSRADQSAGSDIDDHAVSASTSPVEALRRISLDEENLSRRSQDREPYHSDLDGVTSSSYSSRVEAMHSPGQSFDSHGHGATLQWSSRLPGMDMLPIRRNSSPTAATSALAHSDLDGEAEELDIEADVDWEDGKISDDEEFDDTPNLSSPAYKGLSPFGGPGFGSPFRDAREREADDRDQLGLIAQQLQENRRPSTARETGPPVLPPLTTHHMLEAIPDASPPEHGILNPSLPDSESDPHAHIHHPQPLSPTSRSQTPRGPTSPTNAMGMMDLGHGHQHGHGFGSGGGAYRSSSRTSSKASGSPYRASFGNRARSPLGRLSDDEDLSEAIHDSPSRLPHQPPSPSRSGPIRVDHPAFVPSSHCDHAGTSASSSHAGSPHRLSLARQSSSGSGFASIKSPVTPGSGSASYAGGIAGTSPGLGLVDMPRATVRSQEGGVEEEEEEGLAIVFGSKRGRKGSVLGRRSVLDD